MKVHGPCGPKLHVALFRVTDELLAAPELRTPLGSSLPKRDVIQIPDRYMPKADVSEA